MDVIHTQCIGGGYDTACCTETCVSSRWGVRTARFYTEPAALFVWDLDAWAFHHELSIVAVPPLLAPPRECIGTWQSLHYVS